MGPLVSSSSPVVVVEPKTPRPAAARRDVSPQMDPKNQIRS